MGNQQNGHINTLRDWLLMKGYEEIPLQRHMVPEKELNPSQILTCTVHINGIEGRFMIDTGASVSLVDINKTEKFMLRPEENPPFIEAFGAGPGMLEGLTLSETCTLQLGTKEIIRPFVLMDISHINRLLEDTLSGIDGILGIDILNEFQCVLDFQPPALYLKK